jgi:hypothetical protein
VVGESNEENGDGAWVSDLRETDQLFYLTTKYDFKKRLTLEQCSFLSGAST